MTTRWPSERLRASTAENLAGVPYDARGLLATGKSARVDSEAWWQVVFQTHRGWVNARYLTSEISAAAFRNDNRVRTRLSEFSTVVGRRGDLRPIASRYGLQVASFAPPVPVPVNKLATVLRSSKKEALGGPDCGPDTCPQTVYSLAERCAQIEADPDSSVSYDKAVGANGALHGTDYEPPAELANFHWAAVLSNGSETNWSACYFSFTYEDGRPVLAGLSVDSPGI